MLLWLNADTSYFAVPGHLGKPVHGLNRSRNGPVHNRQKPNGENYKVRMSKYWNLACSREIWKHARGLFVVGLLRFNVLIQLVLNAKTNANETHSLDKTPASGKKSIPVPFRYTRASFFSVVTVVVVATQKRIRYLLQIVSKLNDFHLIWIYWWINMRW